MSFAAVDIGNTSIKICQWEPTFHWQSLKISIEDALHECSKRGIDRVAYCTTRSLGATERAAIDNAGWWQLTAAAKLPIELDYASLGTLGADRIAGAVGAWTRYGGETVMIVDAGTALTLDIVEAPGIFRGGNISPGLGMRLDALHNYTSNLPRVDNVMEVKGYMGHDTHTAIMAGCRYGMAYEVDGTFRTCAVKMGCRIVVVTGGDGALLCGDLSYLNNGEYKLDYVAELITTGLRTAYELNHEK